MAHYALLDTDNTVVNVITGKNETELIEGLLPEIWYGQFHNLVCKRTSLNTGAGVHVLGGTPFRKNYAVVGGTYDATRDAFIGFPAPFPSWTFNETTCTYLAPVPNPTNDDGVGWIWNEATLNWELLYPINLVP